MKKTIVEHIECPECKKIYYGKTQVQTHLKKIHGYSQEQILENKLKMSNIITQTELRASQSRDINNLKKYGVKNVFQRSDVKETIKQTCLDRFGVENGGGSIQAQEKIKQSNKKHYGLEHSWQAKEVKDKIKETLLNNYGVDNPLKSIKIKNKIINTNLEKYGEKWHLCTKESQDKITNTCLQKYGTNRATGNNDIKLKLKTSHFNHYGKWYSQTEEHFHKNYQWKDHIMPSGNIVRVMGYEGPALNDLAIKYGEENLVLGSEDMVKHIGEIWYEYDGKIKRYFPDAYVKSINAVVEVKCKYTWNSELDKNQAKLEGVKKAGFKCFLYLFTDNGLTFDIIE